MLDLIAVRSSISLTFELTFDSTVKCAVKTVPVKQNRYLCAKFTTQLVRTESRALSVRPFIVLDQIFGKLIV